MPTWCGVLGKARKSLSQGSKLDCCMHAKEPLEPVRHNLDSELLNNGHLLAESTLAWTTE